jgi:hypothetical protein
MTSIDDIKKFLSGMVVLSPIPDWIFRLLELFEEEQVPSTYSHARCRTFILITFELTLITRCAAPSVYVQYHLAKNIPSNFIAIGDSVLKLNPVRG